MKLYGFAVRSKPWEITHLAEMLDDDRFRDIISGHPFTPSKYPKMFIAAETEIGHVPVQTELFEIRNSLTDTLMRSCADYVPPPAEEKVDWEDL